MHKTTLVKHRGYSANIDVKLAPIILKLWQLNIRTFNCCQENQPGIAWIEFASAIDAQEFLNLVAEYPTLKDLKRTKFWKTRYGRIMNYEDGNVKNWQYDILLDNYGVEQTLDEQLDMVEDNFTGRNDFGFSVSIRFPISDIKFIKEKLLKWNF